MIQVGLDAQALGQVKLITRNQHLITSNQKERTFANGVNAYRTDLRRTYILACLLYCVATRSQVPHINPSFPSLPDHHPCDIIQSTAVSTNVCRDY